ncbi:MAG: hypothetical protein IJC89_03625 [Clostridia bacterium]|nr:hypothetical protein [Clostridia bacterium]
MYNCGYYNNSCSNYSDNWEQAYRRGFCDGMRYCGCCNNNSDYNNSCNNGCDCGCTNSCNNNCGCSRCSY